MKMKLSWGKRDKYETRTDKINAERIIGKIARLFSCDYKKLPAPPEGPYRADYLLWSGTPDINGNFSGDIVGVAEVKKRNWSYSQIGHIRLGLDKIVECLYFAELLGAPFFFIVEFKEGEIGYFDFTEKNNLGEKKWPLNLLRFIPEVRTTQTRDTGDLEPGLLIPMSGFVIINGDKKGGDNGVKRNRFTTGQTA